MSPHLTYEETEAKWELVICSWPWSQWMAELGTSQCHARISTNHWTTCVSVQPDRLLLFFFFFAYKRLTLCMYVCMLVSGVQKPVILKVWSVKNQLWTTGRNSDSGASTYWGTVSEIWAQGCAMCNLIVLSFSPPPPLYSDAQWCWRTSSISILN